MTNPILARFSSALVIAAALLICTLVIYIGWGSGGDGPVNGGPGSQSPSRESGDSGGTQPGLGARQVVAARDPARSDVSGLVVRVRIADGPPVAGADVLVWSGGGAYCSARTNRLGRVSFRELSGKGSVLVIAPGRLPEILEGVPLVGTREVELRAGVSITGEVRVDGALPDRDLSLQLLPQDRGASLAKGLPRSVQTWFLQRRREIACGLVRTDATGRFCIDGLPENWSGYLAFEPRYRMRPDCVDRSLLVGRRGVRVEPGKSHYVLDLFEIPNTECRLEYVGEGVPVVGAVVTVAPSVAGATVGQETVFTDEGGRFRVVASPVPAELEKFVDPVGRPELEASRLFVEYDGLRKKVVLPPRSAGHSGPQVVTVPRGKFSTQRFRVRSMDGGSLGGAVVSAGGAVATANDQGEGEIRVAGGDGAVKVIVGAPGFRFVQKECKASAGVWEFALTPGGKLVVALDPPGPNHGLGLFVLADGSAFASAPAGMSRAHARLMSCRSDRIGARMGGASSRWRFGIGQNGVVELHDLAVGVPLRLECRDLLGLVVGSLEIRGLARDETRRVRLGVTREERRVRVRVVDQNGAKIERTRVRLSVAEPAEDSWRFVDGWTDEHGKVAFRGVHANRSKLVVTAVGARGGRYSAPVQVEETTVRIHR